MMRLGSPSSLLSVVALAAALSLLQGCTTRSTEKESPLSPMTARSTDGVLSYKIPEGWFDASADSASGGFTVWLLRPDFRASIAVSEVHLDVAARGTILGEGGIVELARLSMALTMGGRTGGTVEQQPEEFRLNGAPACRYEVRTDPDTLLRTVLLQIDGKFYAITAYSSLREREDVVAVQQAFLETLSW